MILLVKLKVASFAASILLFNFSNSLCPIPVTSNKIGPNIDKAVAIAPTGPGNRLNVAPSPDNTPSNFWEEVKLSSITVFINCKPPANPIAPLDTVSKIFATFAPLPKRLILLRDSCSLCELLSKVTLACSASAWLDFFKAIISSLAAAITAFFSLLVASTFWPLKIE